MPNDPALHPCPWCRRRPSSGVALEPTDAPYEQHPGDVVVCLFCARPSIVAATGDGLRRPSPSELAMLAQHPAFRNALRVALRVLARAAKWN